MSKIGTSMARGAAWMVGFRLLERLIGLISTLILARLLLPQDFGIIAMAMSFVAILDILWSFAFDSALIQQHNAKRSHFDSAWTLNVLVGFTMASGLLLISYPASLFYGDERLVAIICCLAVGEVFRGFENIGMVLWRKEMQFSSEFKFQVSRKIAGFVVTIPLAFYLRSYWALVAGMLTLRFAGLILSYVLHSYRPRFSLTAWRDLVGFSKWLFINSAVFAIQTRTQDFTIGKLNGASGLGLYTVAHEISTMATTEIVFPINRAVFPGFAKMAEEEPSALLTGYLSVMSLVALLTLPIGFGLSASADWLIPVMLGKNWLDAIPIVQVLGVYGGLASLGSVFGPALMATGKVKVMSVLSMLNVSLFVPAIIYGAMTDGPLGAAWGALTVVIIMLPVSHWIVAWVLGVPLKSVFSALWRPFVAVGIMFSVVTLGINHVGVVDEFSILVAYLGAIVITGAVVYTLALLLLWIVSGKPAGGEKMALDAIVQKIVLLRNRRFPT